MKSHRNDRLKANPAPAVPSFGFTGLPKKPDVVVPPLLHDNIDRRDRNYKKRKSNKRKTNKLGLTPKAEVAEDSDVSIDEEEAFAKSGKP
jgi:hypothetical protein